MRKVERDVWERTANNVFKESEGRRRGGGRKATCSLDELASLDCSEGSTGKAKLLAMVRAHLDRGRLDRIHAAIEDAESVDAKRRLASATEECCESVTVVAEGMELRSSLFCVPIVISFGQPVGTIHLDQMLEGFEVSGALNTFPFCGCDGIGCFVVVPRFWSLRELQSLGLERIRGDALTFPVDRNRNMASLSKRDGGLAEYGRHARVFLRFLIGHVVDMEKRADEVRAMTAAAIERILMELENTVPAGAVWQIKCSGSFFDNLRTGMWVYQNKRLMEEVRLALARNAVGNKLIGTVTTALPGIYPQHSVGLFLGEKLWRGQGLVLSGRPYENAERSASRVEELLKSENAQEVFRFDKQQGFRKNKVLSCGGVSINNAVMIAF